jgi:Na+/H+-dicarboxylate symporter
MVVVPLVMASVMGGILGLGDVRRLGKPVGYAITYYMSTTILAVITGLIVVNIVNPRRGIDKGLVETLVRKARKRWRTSPARMISEVSGSQRESNRT